MRLERHERDSSTWQKVEAYINERLDALRTNNDADLDPIQTALVRGRIRELKALVDQSQDDQPLVTMDE